MTGRFVHARLPETVARRLMLAGEAVPAEFGDRADREDVDVREVR